MALCLGKRGGCTLGFCTKLAAKALSEHPIHCRGIGRQNTRFKLDDVAKTASTTPGYRFFDGVFPLPMGEIAEDHLWHCLYEPLEPLLVTATEQSAHFIGP